MAQADQALQTGGGPSATQRLMWNVTDTIVMTRRNLIRYRRLPQLIVFSSIQPIMFVLLFNYVFGGAIRTGPFDYTNYLLPGVFVQAVVFGAMNTSVGLADDLSKGMVDRFRSLPMARAAMLAGRTLADTVRNVFVVILMVAVGYLIGFRFQDGLVSALMAMGIAVLFGHALQWIAALIGLIIKDPETAQVAGFVWLFPLVFASSIFVPVSTMPDGLRQFAEHQPISRIVNSVRAYTLGTPKDDVWMALAWIAAIMAVFVPLSIWQYRRSTGS